MFARLPERLFALAAQPVAVIAVDEAGAGLDPRQNDRLAPQELDHGARAGDVKGCGEHRAVDAGVAGATRVGHGRRSPRAPRRCAP